jgi:Nucleotide modification associated domain 5
MTTIKTVKLTDHLRRVISDELMKEKYVAEFDAVYANAARLAADVYSHYFSEAEVTDPNLLKRMNALPAGWLPELDAVVARFGGPKAQIQKLHFNGYSRFLPWKHWGNNEKPFEDKRRFRQTDLYRDAHVVVSRDHPLALRFFSLSTQAESLVKERKKLESEITGVLCSVTTTGKLVSIWPEVEPIVAKLSPIERPAGNLPAKVLNNLNAQLGLKKVAA